MKKLIDRYEAGQLLAVELKSYENSPNAIVLALPRGGVPVAYEIASRLAIPLDVFIVRKLGMPGHEELALGAIATGGATVFNENIFREFKIDKKNIDVVIQSEKKELIRREKVYRGNRPFPDLTGKIVILVDDGIATGATIRAAIMALRQCKPYRIIVAVPVAAYSTYNEISALVDKLVCLIKPEDFYAVGAYYDNFAQTTDEEVFSLLNKSHKRNL